MAAIDAFGSIPQEIAELEDNIKELKTKINANELKQELGEVVKQWKQERKEYEAKLEVKREQARIVNIVAKIEALLAQEPSPQQMETLALWRAQLAKAQGQVVQLELLGGSALSEIVACGTPSAFGTGAYKKCESLPHLLHHRPGSQAGLHPALYYPGFGVMEELDQLQCSKSDDDFTLTLAELVSSYYSSEALRVEAVKDHLLAYLEIPLSADTYAYKTSSTQTDLSAKTMTPLGFSATYLIKEFKNELGSAGEPLMQSISMYAHINQEGKWAALCNAPCLLVQLSGPHVWVFGIVQVGDNCIVEPLCPPLTMLLTPDNPRLLRRMTKTWSALKKTAGQLRDYYQHFQPPGHLLEYPSASATDVTFTGTIKRNVFRGRIIASGQPVVVKFVHTYSADAHNACHAAGFAPALIRCDRVPGTPFLVVIMEDLADSVPLIQYLQDRACPVAAVHDGCLRALQSLHNAGFVHGDFRPDNILVRQRQPADAASGPAVAVVDFDWAGRAGVARYPFGMNHRDLEWPAGTCAEALVLAAHDLAWLTQTFAAPLARLLMAPPPGPPQKKPRMDIDG